MKKADMHIHSNASDGKLAPEQIVLLAKTNGLDYISITDHNTVAGVKNAVKEGEKLGVKVIPGVELSTRYKGSQVHLLGYFKGNEYNNEKFLMGLELLRKKRLGKFNEIFKGKFKIKKGAKRLNIEEGIRFLKMFGAAIFIAHPIKIKKDNLEEILKMKIDGIEAIHPRHTEEEKIYFKKLAEYKGKKYTAGTDFHSLDKGKEKHGIIGELYIEIKEIKEILGF